MIPYEKEIICKKRFAALVCEYIRMFSPAFVRRGWVASSELFFTHTERPKVSLFRVAGAAPADLCDVSSFQPRF